ncbi:MAG: putative endoglucanase [Planctomycetes bacterium ADurb.Bin126]|nr:MAG: putative endoglucanase [Planctomycetes bacterium ADurb.Bin126]
MYKTLIDTRADQGYSVVHMAFLGTIQTPGGKASHGDLFERRVNPAYWQKVDRYIEYANARGIVPVIGFGLHQYLNTTSLKQLQELWRYALARLGSHAVAFLICGEYNQRGKDLAAAARVDKILHLGQYIRERDPYKRALTVHPWATGVEGRQMWTQGWYDVIMLQGGHGRTPPAVSAYRQALDHKPTRPVIEGECKYEGIHRFTAGEVRHVAYRAFQAGCRGFTYGSHGLWYPTRDENDRKFDNWGSPMPWWRAYKRPGGAQMKHFHARYESLEWWRLQPLPQAVRTEPQLDEQRQPLVQGLPAGKPGHARPLYLIYFSAGSDEAATLTGLPPAAAPRYGAQWFDPRTGEQKPAGELVAEGGALRLPDRPSAVDWVLRLRS